MKGDGDLGLVERVVEGDGCSGWFGKEQQHHSVKC